MSAPAPAAGPVEAVTRFLRVRRVPRSCRSWVPAFAGMTMVGAAALGGCDTKAPREATNLPVGKAQAAADAASAAYAGCVDRAANAVDVHADQPATLTDKAMKSCIAERGVAVARVQAAEMARGGDPLITAEVAERSLRVADGELRDRANATIVTRKYSDKKAS